MILYYKTKDSFTEVKEKPFKLEKDLQQLFEENLSSIMNLTLVKSEFVIKDRRFDTLAFDEQSKSFVIIEYKRDRNTSVIDQGFTYLNLMLNNKAEFVLEINERLGRKFKRDEIDWTQTKIIFVSSAFTEYQKKATDFKDIGIELWEVKQYENGSVIVNPIKKTNNSESVKTLAGKSSDLEKISKEIKVYTEEQHLSSSSESIKELYNHFKDAILNLDPSLEVQPRKLYIGFKKKTNICDIEIKKNALKIYLNAKWGNLDDPKHLFQDISKVGHWGNGDYRVTVSDDKNLEYIMSVVKQLL